MLLAVIDAFKPSIATSFFFQFPDGARVASIPRQIWTSLVTLFQGTLKPVASRHKCGNTLPQKNYFLLLVRRFVFKEKRSL